MLPKERILELYFNAIEFGPRIYGIGAAARHYFGKHPSELTPLQAAFFSSILPSPKRRYIQYCHGQLFPPWDKYVRRILTRVYERGRLTEEEYNLAAAQPLRIRPHGAHHDRARVHGLGQEDHLPRCPQIRAARPRSRTARKPVPAARRLATFSVGTTLTARACHCATMRWF